MPFWKQLLLQLYYYGTYPARRRDNARRMAAGCAPAIVLFYHRIADNGATPWTASNRTFARQMRWLKSRFDMVSLAEVQRRLRSGQNFRPCVSITFDDGYADNCHKALPLLLAEQIPCTYFVATRHILEDKLFPHDVGLNVGPRPNTPEQIVELAKAGVEIGVHTRNHADLGRIRDPRRLREEIVDARDELEDLIGSRPRYFAFPYGQHVNLSAVAFAMARDAGYEAVCSAYGGFNFSGDDPFHLQRVHVDNDLIRLKNWVTVDPRKLRMTRRYEYKLGADALQREELVSQ